jgi:hypothetical protein
VRLKLSLRKALIKPQASQVTAVLDSSSLQLTTSPDSAVTPTHSDPSRLYRAFEILPSSSQSSIYKNDFLLAAIAESTIPMADAIAAVSLCQGLYNTSLFFFWRL